jgi:drug/metabolite transporter (DMT)-like permease
MRLDEWRKGLGFAILASFLYALKSAAIKFAPSAKVEFFVFFRFLLDFLLLTPFFLVHRKQLHFKQLPLHFLRAIFVTISIYCSVYGIRHLALVDAILLENTLPLFIPLIAWVWHKQKITLKSFFILLLGFSSLFFLLKPELNIVHLASLASIGAGFASAMSAMSVRTLSKTEHPIAILFYFNAFAGALALVPLAYTWEGMPSWSASFWLPFLLISVFGVLFQYAMNRAYSLISPHVVGNFVYFQVLFSAFFGWTIWHEHVNAMQVLGGILLIGSGFLMIRENKQKTTPNVLQKSDLD